MGSCLGVLESITGDVASTQVPGDPLSLEGHVKSFQGCAQFGAMVQAGHHPLCWWTGAHPLGVRS